MLKNFRHFIDLLIGMTEKELKVRYKNTVFGFLWIVINPILQMIIIGTVFTFFIKEPIQNYYYFLFSGLLVWNFFSLSLSKATPSIVFDRMLIKKAKFPRIVIPVSIILSNFIHMVIAFLLFLAVLLLSRNTDFFKLLILPLPMIWLLLVTIGFSLFATALNVRYRDVNFFIQAVLIVWFYATPIVYKLSFIPERFRWIWFLNPLTVIIQLFQYILLSQPFPDLQVMMFCLLGTILFFILGILFFNRESENFDDWL